jgi:hypothetical protein
LNVPYIFFTGYDRLLLPERFAMIDVITKPRPSKVAVQQLDATANEYGPSTIVELVPKLRERARADLSDPLAADRLVERTLQLVNDPSPGPVRHDLAAWLERLMAQALHSGRKQFLN